jgi:hypothetical protein
LRVRRNLPPPGPPSCPADTKLAREIVRVLAFKTIALTLLYVLFFGPAQRIAVDAGGIAALLLATPSAVEAPR